MEIVELLKAKKLSLKAYSIYTLLLKNSYSVKEISSLINTSENHIYTYLKELRNLNLVTKNESRRYYAIGV